MSAYQAPAPEIVAALLGVFALIAAITGAGVAAARITRAWRAAAARMAAQRRRLEAQARAEIGDDTLAMLRRHGRCTDCGDPGCPRDHAAQGHPRITKRGGRD